VQTTTAQKASQTITVTQGVPATAVFRGTFQIAATAPGGPVAIGAAGACSVKGSTVTIKKGTTKNRICTVTFDQGGNANYLAAPRVVQPRTVREVSQATAARGLRAVKRALRLVNAGRRVSLASRFAAWGGRDGERQDRERWFIGQRK